MGNELVTCSRTTAPSSTHAIKATHWLDPGGVSVRLIRHGLERLRSAHMHVSFLSS